MDDVAYQALLDDFVDSDYPLPANLDFDFEEHESGHQFEHATTPLEEHQRPRDVDEHQRTVFDLQQRLDFT